MLAKVTSCVPTTYSALLASDCYMRAVRIVDEMMTKLRSSDHRGSNPPDILPPPPKPNSGGKGPGSGFGSDPFSNSTNPDPPPKRPRGCPRFARNEHALSRRDFHLGLV